MPNERRKLQLLIEEAAAHPAALDSAEHRAAVEETIGKLDRGELRMAEKVNGEWKVNTWIQQAILLYFRITKMETLHAGPLEYHDRIPLKRDYKRRGLRVIPGAIARYGSHIEPGAVMMPSFAAALPVTWIIRERSPAP